MGADVVDVGCSTDPRYVFGAASRCNHDRETKSVIGWDLVHDRIGDITPTPGGNSVLDQREAIYV